MGKLTVEESNRLDQSTFVNRFGSIYETSPWVAERSWSEQPFSSISDLQKTFERTVENASHERKRELLQAHPDLGEKTEMTESSKEEQASAGLDQLTPDQYEAFHQLNETYREKFGFPFIMSVHDESPETIRNAMEERIDHSQSEEFRTALAEVHEIARLRLEEMLTT